MERNFVAAKIRQFEKDVLEEYQKGKIRGSVHCCIGQELDIVTLIGALVPGDVIVSNHRCHGHYLAFTGDYSGLWDELHGLKTGVNRGEGGSQHIHAKDFYANGVQGGMTPFACGVAMSFKLEGRDSIVMCFIGDGTLGQGILYESLNIASLWNLPVVFVLENNQYAMSTPLAKGIARPDKIKDRFKAFGLKEGKIHKPRAVVPSFIVVDTYRLCGHSANDPCNYRDKQEEKLWAERDKKRWDGLPAAD